MSDVGHVHDSKTRKVYRDFCHYTAVEGTCSECGQTVVTKTSRDFDLNPLQIAFADPDCPECREALRGKEPDSWNALRAGR